MAVHEASADMISDLPKHVIDTIMQFLPLIDAARMSVLSRKWRDTMEGAADMIKFLAGSCGLQTLSLHGDACKILANSGISKILPIPFKQLKILSLFWIGINHMNEFLCAFGLIQSCLNMEKLKISVKAFPSDVNMQELKIWGDGETKNDLEYTFNHLHSIYITDIRGLTLEMKLISYLLAFSPSLKRLSFTCHGTLKAHTESQLRRQILQFRRASPKAELLYLKKAEHYGATLWH